MNIKTAIFATAAAILPFGATFAQTAPEPSQPAAEAQDEATAPAGSAQAGASGEIAPAAATDLKVGAVVKDLAGQKVGTIESVTAQGPVVSTGKNRVQIPPAAIGKKDGGLVIGMSQSELDAAATSKAPTQ